MNGNKIDLVIPYVDNKDIIWRKKYIEYCQTHNKRIKIADINTCRYEDIGLINYHLILANKNYPFINRIFLLVSNKEQVPQDLPNNVIVVLHEQFIPYKYLPTFNSTTIEMFLWRIPNLGEYFIYANDDMLPCKEMKETDFFVNGKIRINFKDDPMRFNNRNEFPYQCWNVYCAMAKLFKSEIQDNTKILRPYHTITPMIKSHCIEIYEKLKNYIIPNIGAFRTIYQYNQYIYPMYELFMGNTEKSDIDFYYTEIEKEEDFNFNHQVVCINMIKDESKIAFIRKELEQLCKKQ